MCTLKQNRMMPLNCLNVTSTADLMSTPNKEEGEDSVPQNGAQESDRKVFSGFLEESSEIKPIEQDNKSNQIIVD